MKRTEYKQPSVELIRDFNAKKEAWMISRPHLDHSNIDKDILGVEAMDLPLNGFAQYVFHVNSSLLFRDLMFTIRPLVVWAKSNRTTPINNKNMFCSGEYEGIYENEIQAMFNEVYEEIESGVPQDFAKKKLPMAANTEFTMSIDDRTLIAFIKVLKLHNKDLYEIYGKKFLEAIGRDEDYVENRHMVDIYPKISLSQQEIEAVGTTHEHLEQFIGVYSISNNLMAQFIRQHFSTIKNGLYNKIEHKSVSDKEVALQRCDDETVVALYADRSSFRKVLSVRAQWFGQWDHKGNDSWSAILDPYVKDMTPEEFMELLPHGNAESTMLEDMKPRIRAGKVEITEDGRTLTGEVNPPCPLLLEKPDLIDFRKQKYGSNSEVFKAWERIRDAGLINDNPDNPWRKEYEHNVKTYGLPE
ncbi:thymidylate synthetase [Bacillus phage SP-15]|uniref:Thymidylate synthetase n=1 Tax=Bacillus phage SP-15 TaxID=1792032 RepID=A0A127AWA5_9CAUD|nr:thymidylate synthetase [Bacillus phage SP-15]AMM44928.1 thymidylate synthetase [Bacillus phage SP-15]